MAASVILAFTWRCTKESGEQDWVKAESVNNEKRRRVRIALLCVDFIVVMSL
jgi:hypothetical protein